MLVYTVHRFYWVFPNLCNTSESAKRKTWFTTSLLTFPTVTGELKQLVWLVFKLVYECFTQLWILYHHFNLHDGCTWTHCAFWCCKDLEISSNTVVLAQWKFKQKSRAVSLANQITLKTFECYFGGYWWNQEQGNKKWETRNEEMGGNVKWCTRKWKRTLFLIEDRWLSQLESMSEEVVTALLEYIRQIRELIVTNLQYSYNKFLTDWW